MALGQAQFFDDSGAFDAALGAAGKIPKGDWACQNNQGPSAILGFTSPLNINNPGPYDPGPMLDNLTFQSNQNPFGIPDTNPTATNDLVLVNAPGFGLSGNAVLGNYFVDSFDILSGPPAGDNHTALGMTVVSLLGGGGPLTVTVFDKNNTVIGQHDVPGGGPEQFVGILAPDTIGRVNVYDQSDGAQGITNITAYVEGGPSGGCCQCDAMGAQFCTVVSPDICDTVGGEYLGDDTDCDGGDCAIDFPDQCTPLGACCQCDDIVPFCTLETQDDCNALGGDYQGDFVLCDPFPCDPDGCLGVDVSVDIRPGGCNNPFNRASNGVLKVAVAGSDDFDVLGIDVSTVKIWRLDGVGGAVGPNFGPPGPAPRFSDATDSFMGDLCECPDPRTPDGILDLVVKFRSADVTEVLELGDLPAGLIVPLCVGGDMLDGTAFEGCDCAWLVGTDGYAGMVTLESNLVDIWVKSTPADDYEDEGGFTNFSRFYPLGTEITFSAPLVPSMHSNLILRGWWLNGEFRKDLGTEVTVTLDTPLVDLAPLYGVNFLRPSTPDSDSGSDGTAAH
ncbi:MAG: hypothetical protein ACYSWT_07810 [Planctomycetota bacterium]|jgi:hypothetical protein